MSHDTSPPAFDGSYVVEIERFQGPLDLLLHLIRQQDIDIFDIPIARITRQFLNAIQGIQAADLDQAGEFLEMAATLVRIKAQLLIPRPSDSEDDDPRAELVRRLLEYEQIREITRRMEVAESQRARRFAKGFVPVRPRIPADEVPLENSWEDVFEAALQVEVPLLQQREHRVTPRTVSMEEKSALILSALAKVTGIEFRSLLTPFHDRMHGVMTFLAGLELTRRRRVRLRQVAPFSELWLYRREKSDWANEDMDGVRGDDGPHLEGAPDAEDTAVTTHVEEA